MMGIFQGKKRTLLILLTTLFVGFCGGVLTQRVGIPGKLKQLVFGRKSIYTPITVLQEVERKEPPQVWLRRFPYPFKCALAIASDIDYCSVEEFDEIHRFLNTTEMTTMGPGLGLDIADSMWMYDIADVYPSDGFPSSMSYWKGITPGTIKDAERILQYIGKGWIDSLHTYGNFARIKNKFRRELAKAALEELSSKGVFLDTWIDHGDECNTQCFAHYYSASFEHGDDPNSSEYHTDLLISYGVRYAWGRGRQEFGTEEPAVPLTLRDGRRIWLFSRYYYDSPGTEGRNCFPNNIDRQLTENNLKKLIEGNLWEIVANHFGAPTPGKEGRVETRPPFGPESRNLLRRLAYEFRRGNIMVLRTSRLLKYYVVSKHLDWVYDSDTNTILIKSVDDSVFGRYVPTLADVRGITFYVSSPIHPDIILGDRKLADEELVWNAHDGTAYSVTILPYFTYY
jgi:hypothetical protein